MQSSRKGKGFNLTDRLRISAEREPLADLTVSANEVKVTVELPGINKENIRIDAYDGAVEVTTNDIQRKYHRMIELPPETDIERAKSKYNNGIVEVIFDKKQQTKTKGKEIKIE